jgi:hypothetical protein
MLIIGRNKSARVFGFIAFAMVIIGNLNMNSDMELLGSRGFWSDGYMPLYFLSLSALIGCAAHCVVHLDELYCFISTACSSQDEIALVAIGRLFFVLITGYFLFHNRQNNERIFSEIQ